MRKPDGSTSGERLCFYVLPLFLYMSLIFALSSLSRYPEAPSWVFGFDKFVHTLEYYILGYLLMRALVTSPHGIFAEVPAAFAMIFGTLYAISDEWHQSFVPGRYASAFDVIFDILGVVIAVLTYRLVRHRVRWIRTIEKRIEGRMCNGEKIGCYGGRSRRFRKEHGQQNTRRKALLYVSGYGAPLPGGCLARDAARRVDRG
jgi:VanZ family protein